MIAISEGCQKPSCDFCLYENNYSSITFIFKDCNGKIIDLSGVDVSLLAKHSCNGPTIVNIPAEIKDPTSGKAVFYFQGDTFDFNSCSNVSLHYDIVFIYQGVNPPNNKYTAATGTITIYPSQ